MSEITMCDDLEVTTNEFVDRTADDVHKAVDEVVDGAVNRFVYGAVHGAAVGPVNEPLYYNIRTIINQITEAK